MSTVLSPDLDFIEELRMRRWARENYVPRPQRHSSWHPIVHDEMSRKDGESGERDARPDFVWRPA